MKIRFFNGVSALAFGIGALAVSAPGFAQTEPADGAAAATQPSPEAESTGSGDIIVTAQRRSERLQDVPISIAAFSGDQIAERGIATSKEIGQLTTGIVIATDDSAVVPFIRGIGSNTAILGEVGSVATYLDGVYLPETTGAVYELANIESIEVLKGPQGTLFGRNTSGGAINIRTKAPSFTTTGSFEASYGRFDALNLRGFLSGPVSDKIAVSVASNYSRQDGYINDLVRGGKIDGAKRFAIRGAILFQPTDRLDITVSGDYLRNDDPTGAAVSALNGYFGQTAASIAPRGPRDYIGSIKPAQDVLQAGGSLKAVYDVGFGNLTALTAYRYTRINSAIEVDRTPEQLIDLTDHRLVHVFSQELQLSSNNDGPFTWLIGGYYSDSDAAYSPVTLIGSLAGGTTAIYNKAKSTIYAGFVNGTYKFGDFEVTGGLRYNKDVKSYVGSVNGFPIVTPGMVRETWNSLTPRVVLSYHPNRDLLLYASYTAGFKSGAYNTTAFALVPIDPEKVKAYEVGLKISPTPGVTVNSALFWYDRTNEQVQAQDPVSGLQNLENAAKSRSKGAEIEITARPLPGLSLQAGASYLDARYLSFPEAIVYTPTPVGPGMIPGSLGNTATSTDISGERTERSPKWNFTLAGSYKIELANGGSIVPSGNIYRTSSYVFGAGGRLRQPGFTLINAELAWNLPNGVTLAAWGRNLTNKTYYINFKSNAFSDSGTANEPRTYGVRASYRF